MQAIKTFFLTKSPIDRAIIIVVIGVVVVTFAFGGYYYFDRYVAFGDQSLTEQGIAELEQIVRDNPDDINARLALAQFYFDTGNYSKAIDQADQVLNAFPDTEPAMYILGRAYYQLGEYESALSHLEDFAIRRSNTDMAHADTTLETAFYFIGEMHNHLGDPEAAIEALQTALAIDFTDADALYQLGLAYAATDQHDLAVVQYHRATQFVPDFLEAYQAMAVSYSELDEPGYEAYALGMAAFSTKDYETAATYLVDAVEAHPDFAPAFLGLGLTLEALGEYETALEYLVLGQALDPDNFMINNTIARIHLATGQ